MSLKVNEERESRGVRGNMARGLGVVRRNKRRGIRRSRGNVGGVSEVRGR